MSWIAMMFMAFYWTFYRCSSQIIIVTKTFFSLVFLFLINIEMTVSAGVSLKHMCFSVYLYGC